MASLCFILLMVLTVVVIVVGDDSTKALVKGKRIALFQVHFEGNIGDQMETIPLLRKLKEWGVEVDCYLSIWMPLEKRLNSDVHKRIEKYVSNIYAEGIPYTSVLVERGYDLAIMAPGPTVNEIKYCFGRIGSDGIQRNVSFVYFGLSVSKSKLEVAYERHKHCLKLVAAREPVTFENVKSSIKLEGAKLMLSGDISFSYLDGPYHRPNVPTMYPHIHNAISRFKEMGNDWVLIFSRSNNFGTGASGVVIKKGIVWVTTIDNKKLSFEIDKVLFASSDRHEDTQHLLNLRKKHNVHKLNTILLNSVEEMFALISLSIHVVTDRYHPGVATSILGKKLTIIMYKAEHVKMQGLHAMRKYTPSSIKLMNDRAFDALFSILSGVSEKEVRKMNKRGKNARVSDSKSA